MKKRFELRYLNRRDFLIASALLLLSGKTLVDVCRNEYQKHLRHRIYHDLTDDIYVVITKGKVGVEEKYAIKRTYKASGIVIDDYFLSCAHATNIGIKYDYHPFFGLMKTELNIFESEAKIKGITLEKVIESKELDISVLRLPKGHGLPTFPCEISTERKLGDEVYLIGNPDLKGFNIRKGYISDLDGVGNDEKDMLYQLTKGTFGTTIRGISGDTGCPFVNSDFKLIGIQSSHINRLAYANKIENYLPYLNKIKEKRFKIQEVKK